MYAHGIMFHYFHDDQKIKRTQGSISGEKLCKIIETIRKSHNLISADEFLHRGIEGKLQENDVCLTFDDGLNSQYQVAYPILKSYDLTAFWFIYTSVHIKGEYEKLEVYRVFRNSFEDMESFYIAFYQELNLGEYISAIDGWNSSNAGHYKPEAEYYTENDRRFRYVRDFVLSDAEYDKIIQSMMGTRDFSIEKECKGIWINSDQLGVLCKEGHVIGLHSHTHPTVMSNLNYEDQMREYSTCKQVLEGLLAQAKICSVSYPCDYYNDDTIQIMGELGIKLGFIAHMEENGNPLLVPRRDSADFA